MAAERGSAPVSIVGETGSGETEPARMRWWGWGDPAHAQALPAHALAYLRKAVGGAPAPRAPVALDAVSLPASRLDGTALARLRQIAGSEYVRDGRGERIVHAAGKGYPDLVRLRAGRPQGAPDAVLYPGSRVQLAELLGECARSSIAVVPFGGGTSVVGGVEPLRGAQRAVVALDMARLAGVVDLDEASLTVTAGAGMRVRDLEEELGARGFTLGHFPQSYEYVSIGGCAATRSAGQASTGYGRFEQLVRGSKLTTPTGVIDLRALPASAAGPSLRELIVGSEGTLGTIDELSLRVRRAPVERAYEGAFFASFQAGAEALRELAQRHLAPDVARLSDGSETAVALALAGRGGAKGVLGRAYVRARGYAGGCLAILGFEGEAKEVASRREQARRVVRAHTGLPVGGSPGRAWLRSRFSAPYLRDELLTHGVMVETLETATQWSNLLALHRAVGDAIDQALRACGTPGIVSCHVSHLYETGASLYFTFVARQLQDEEIAQWQAVKTAASAAILAGGGTITHHHAVGRDHAPWLEQEIGREGVRALRALKQELDPTAIMNPGKLLP
ncbi:MAG TPA: FAD-binding oxidoreductase [Solirubrobacteraceae bacterium]|jgi:alkyldihydroxyacetonephosphate synthase|nr:FAD-binding oxidoreductase [Solirubrobacteraceae bacterium]